MLHSLKKNLYLLLAPTLFIAGSSSAQPQGSLSVSKTKTIDSLMAAFMTAEKVPGTSFAIRYQGQSWQKGYGMADVENQLRATPATVYRLASVSKPVTAVAVMQLVEKGKIDLDAPIQTYIPSFPLKKYRVTTRQLLGHLSGIRHYQGEEEESTKEYKSLTEGLAIFQDDSLLHKPTEQFTYSTFGYTVLGVLIEHVSGMRFTDYLQEFVFKPAQMLHTRSDEITAIILNRARGYGKTEQGQLRNATLMNSSYKTPGGGLVSTVGDMLNFMNALQEGKLLKVSTFQQMTTSLELTSGKETNYGYGWIIGLAGYPKVAWHGGVQQGSTTIIIMLPSGEGSLALLTNMGEIETAR